MTKPTIFSTLWRPISFMTKEQRYSTDLLIISVETFHPDFNPTGIALTTYQDGAAQIIASDASIPDYKKAEWLQCCDAMGGAFFSPVWCDHCDKHHHEPVVPLHYLLMGAPNEILRDITDKWAARQRAEDARVENAQALQGVTVLSFDNFDEFIEAARGLRPPKPTTH